VGGQSRAGVSPVLFAEGDPFSSSLWKKACLALAHAQIRLSFQTLASTGSSSAGAPFDHEQEQDDE
jgi:hypothetical protein